ncbi:uncharacterized protein BO95DRAFT_283540 [Aspergillus brunneoviolaceus CBS 621.78]|uniref:Uncharacterized protein n=1 Tax=Aspergillus brunneoviolaceus CBS 621.78 TaxID=1450534 RepID=A0ACD1GJI6_9EURO|nr:hypothetical protein BO95DRAFT_283540 [Aspergillus brunneoviolaceus CBS 621.78]RAH49407.1 hypothetical protein BO95DRAFT_283540 [Aspergillus brunneoviolaceus CBS 621.78]
MVCVVDINILVVLTTVIHKRDVPTNANQSDAIQSKPRTRTEPNPDPEPQLSRKNNPPPEEPEAKKERKKRTNNPMEPISNAQPSSRLVLPALPPTPKGNTSLLCSLVYHPSPQNFRPPAERAKKENILRTSSVLGIPKPRPGDSRNSNPYRYHPTQYLPALGMKSSPSSWTTNTT